MIKNLEDLIKFNEGKNYRFVPNKEDFDRTNFIAHLIQSSRSKLSPQPGDVIICKGPKVEYNWGHMEKGCDHDLGSSICTRPMTPHACISVGIHDTPTKAIFDTSGGYWICCDDPEMYVLEDEVREKTFWTWGYQGATAGGGVHFTAMVNVWSLFKEGIY